MRNRNELALTGAIHEHYIRKTQWYIPVRRETVYKEAILVSEYRLIKKGV